MTAKKIFIVIPAYKAGTTLPGVFKRIPKDVYDEVEGIIVVEDGGEGIPRSVTPELEREYPKMEVLFHPKNRGYGGAQKTGFKRVLERGGDVAVLLHADGQYAPEEMKRLYTPLVDGSADVVLGSRMRKWSGALKGGMPFYKFVANIGLSTLENIAYGMKLSEYHSGYMLYSRKALETIPFEKLANTFHFDGEMLIMAGIAKLRIADLPIPTHYGDEESHLKPIQYGFEVLGVIRKYMGGYYHGLLSN